MKVLYAIQGTGNGHLSRALDIIPHLQRYCQCDILISGTQCDLELGMPVKYRLKGFSFIFGKSGGIDYWKSFDQFKLGNFIREITSLQVEDYDLVINDFEPVSAWACKLKKVPALGLSHQGAFLSNKVPLPDKKDYFGAFILKNYAPVADHLAFHFQAYDKNIHTPVIRRQVREAVVEEQEHYTVYLPSFDDKYLVEVLSRFGEVQWHLFSKHAKTAYQEGNVRVSMITNEAFVADMALSKGVLCGAGFETPAEALFLKKKLLVIPMKGQYEQQCNAAALEEMGVPVIWRLREDQMHQIADWLASPGKVAVNYPDQTSAIVRRIFEMDILRILMKNKWYSGYQLTLGQFHTKRAVFQ